MLTVLGRRNSANVQKVMWALGELSLQYVRDDVGGSFGYPDDYPNPNKVVPTLMDDQQIVWESNACVRYLARTYGQGTLWPDDDACLTEADIWMEWQRSDISFAFFPLFQMLVRGLPATPEEISKKVVACGRWFAQLDQQLAGRQFICGDQLTMADIVNGAMAYRYFTLPIERPELPDMQSWYQRLCERPAYQKHVMIEYGSNLEQWNTHEAANANIQ
ncbi:MAG: glutathione S-transferase family protein [Pseudomonadaceae bacterium]|jgi:glutathione S-transferase|nr:glutathione S-transferase family protein [Pseudomonadaceae bacterium]